MTGPALCLGELGVLRELGELGVLGELGGLGDGDLLLLLAVKGIS